MTSESRVLIPVDQSVVDALTTRVARLERLLFCSNCSGTGVEDHAILGRKSCAYCEGTGIHSDMHMEGRGQ